MSRGSRATSLYVLVSTNWRTLAAIRTSAKNSDSKTGTGCKSQSHEDTNKQRLRQHKHQQWCCCSATVTVEQLTNEAVVKPSTATTNVSNNKVP